MKYKPIYKCPLCNQLIGYGNAIDVPYDILPEVLAKIVRNQQFAGHPILHQAPMHIPHQCKNGGAGLASFAGFLPERSDNT